MTFLPAFNLPAVLNFLLWDLSLTHPYCSVYFYIHLTWHGPLPCPLGEKAGLLGMSYIQKEEEGEVRL